MKLYEIEHSLWKRHIPFLPRIIKALIYVFFHCVIPPECSIGKGTVLWHHGLGIVIHPNVRIGNNCHLYNHVVLGGGHDGPDGPPVDIRIGDNVTITTGAKVLCRDTLLVIGENSIIGANAVVLNDVPPNVVMGGIPARVLKQKSSRPVI